VVKIVYVRMIASRRFNKELWMARSRSKFDGSFQWQQETRVLEQWVRIQGPVAVAISGNEKRVSQ
jgi:hypothetical protein